MTNYLLSAGSFTSTIRVKVIRLVAKADVEVRNHFIGSWGVGWQALKNVPSIIKLILFDFESVIKRLQHQRMV